MCLFCIESIRIPLVFQAIFRERSSFMGSTSWSKSIQGFGKIKWYILTGL